MITINSCKEITTNFENLESKALATIKALVDDRGGRIEFDWENGDAPSIDSMQFICDVADSYIKALHTDGEMLYADLHAYYLKEDLDDVNIINNENICWCSLLNDLLPYLTFPHYYLVNVLGKDGYSFMVEIDEDMDEAVKCGDYYNIIEIAYKAELFNDEDDAYQCNVSIADDNDIKHFSVFSFVKKYKK